MMLISYRTASHGFRQVILSIGNIQKEQERNVPVHLMLCFKMLATGNRS